MFDLLLSLAFPKAKIPAIVGDALDALPALVTAIGSAVKAKSPQKRAARIVKAIDAWADDALDSAPGWASLPEADRDTVHRAIGIIADLIATEASKGDKP